MSILFTWGPGWPSAFILNDEEFPPVSLIELMCMPLLLLFMILIVWVTEPVVVKTVSKCKLSALVVRKAAALLVKLSFLQARRSSKGIIINKRLLTGNFIK